MCGIAGILELSGGTAGETDVLALTGRMLHRGPDGDGVHLQGPIGLGHRRLSIIDLAGGVQPMANDDGSVWLTYNGELYNYVELRETLKARGRTFRTASDTEVILRAWEEWGEACVEHFRGMFALAIADHRRGKLFLARDQLGIKPLYYFRNGRRLAFASELQALRGLSDCPRDIDPKAIDTYLYLLYVPPPATIYRDVHKLAPGHRLTVGFDGATSGPEAYWTLKFQPEAGGSVEAWTERLEAVLKDSVRCHLAADVPYGAFLSGGIDSTAVVSMMSEELSHPVKTFAIGFDEADFNELGYARQVAERFATDHHEEVVRPDTIATLPTLVRHYGEPFGDSSAIPTYFVSRLAGRHVKMVLSGDGGDEAFLGYSRYFRWHDWIHPAELRRGGWKDVARPMLQSLLPQRFPATRTVQPADWLDWMAGLDGPHRTALWRPEWKALAQEPVPELAGILAAARSVPPEQYGQYIDYLTYLPNDILTKVDIASMIHSLESRTPLVDVRVAEFTARIPWQMNMRRDSEGRWTGKHLLKRIVGKHFGPDFLERKKAGFAIPLNHWFARGGALRVELEDRLRSPNAQIYHYLEPQAVHRLIDGHSPVQDHAQCLWQLLFLEAWLDHAGEEARPAYAMAG